MVGGSRTARGVFLPVWAAYPAVGAGDCDTLPGSRLEVAGRLVGRGTRVTWTVAFLSLVVEGARAASRELDRLVAAAEQGRELVAACDARSRLPDAIDAALRISALDPEGARQAAPHRAADHHRAAARIADRSPDGRASGRSLSE